MVCCALLLNCSKSTTVFRRPIGASRCSALGALELFNVGGYSLNNPPIINIRTAQPTSNNTAITASDATARPVLTIDAATQIQRVTRWLRLASVYPADMKATVVKPAVASKASRSGAHWCPPHVMNDANGPRLSVDGMNIITSR